MVILLWVVPVNRDGHVSSGSVRVWRLSGIILTFFSWLAWELWVRALGVKDALEGLVGILVIFLGVIGIGVFIESLFVSIDHFGKSFGRGVLHLVGTIIFGAMIPATYFAEKWIFKKDDSKDSD